MAGRPFDHARARIASVILDEVRSLPASDDFDLPMPTDPRLLRIANALADRPADSRSLDAWADWAGITPRTMSRRFVTETGFTFTQWRQRIRLTRALELLASGAAVTTVALDLGYDNPSAFIALFKRTYGVTPAAWRDAL